MRRIDGGKLVNQKVQRIGKEDVRTAVTRMKLVQMTYLWRYRDVQETFSQTMFKEWRKRVPAAVFKNKGDDG